MTQTEATQHVIDVLSRALEVEYGMIVHYPRIARLLPSEALAMRADLLGQDSIRHADIVAKAITELGGVAPFPSFEPLPEPLDLAEFFKTQLERERLALSLHNEAAEGADERLAPSLREVAEQEKWHIAVVEEIIAKLS